MNRFKQFVPGAGLILDPTCGPGEWWAEFPQANVIKMDWKNPEAATVLGNATLLPFHDHTFDEIWCDPPHLVRNDVKHWNPTYLRYGHWPTRKLWLVFLTAINIEFARVLKPNGRLLMKIISGSRDKKGRVIHRSEVMEHMQLWKVSGEETWASGASWSTCTSHLIEMRLGRLHE